MLASFAAALAALATAQSATDSADDRAQVRCDVAWAYIEWQLSQPGQQRAVFSTEALYPFIPDDYPRHWGAVDSVSQVPPPPAGLVEAIPGGSNAVQSCGSIQRLLRARGLRFGDGAVDWASQVRRGHHFRARIITVTLPALSADGAHAVLVENSSRGGLDSGEGWVHMERGSDGRWRAVGLSALFVS